jgi:AraC-like DNA-binding protein
LNVGIVSQESPLLWTRGVAARETLSYLDRKGIVDLPIISGDSRLLQILTAHADDLLAEKHSVSALQSMVVNQLVDLLPSGEARAAAVAQRLGMSARSFTRYLAEEGTTFGEILERLRQHLASRYLAENRNGAGRYHRR